MRANIPVAVAVLMLIAVGCGPREPVVAELPEGSLLQRADGSLSSPFGGSHPGRSFWLSRNGRYALIYQWREDTNGDGRVSIAIGRHGGMLEDEPQPYLVDMQTGTTTRYDEFLSTSAGGWIALRKERTVWLLDAETGTRTRLSTGQEFAEADGNACAGPRGLVFDTDGTRMGVVDDERGRFVVRSLIDGSRQRRVDGGDDVLWRVRFTHAEDVFVLYVVPTESARADTASGFPRRRTTCTSPLGTLFATSYSFSGWEGPQFDVVVVAPDGRRLRLHEDPVVLSEAIVAVGDTALLRMDGRSVQLPDGCGELQYAPGAGSVLLECGDEMLLFDPDDGRGISLTRPVWLVEDAYGVRDNHGRTWLPVLVPDATNARGTVQHLSRLRVHDGRLEVGPAVSSDVAVAGDGWIVAPSGQVLKAFNITTGRHVTVPLDDGVLFVEFPRVWQRSGSILLLDPAGGRYLEAKDPGASNDRGCYVEATGEHPGRSMTGRVEQGPWTLRCAAGEPSMGGNT